MADALEAKMASLDIINDDGPVLLRVGGMLFALSNNTITKLDSDFLNKLVDPDTSFQKPADGIYVVQGSAECFAAIVSMVEYGSLPASIVREKEKQTELLHEAAFWGIEARVAHALESEKEKAKPSRSLLQTAMALAIDVEKAKCHHNHRQDDRRGRIYCSDCGKRYMDHRFRPGELYTSCVKCKKSINYNPDLGWCHKCGCCQSCQSTECPFDIYARCKYYHPDPPKTTEEREKELEGFLAAETSW